MIESVTKGDTYTNWQGREAVAPGHGLILEGVFVSDEELAQRLAKHGWKCRKRDGRAPDEKGSEECATKEG